VFSLGLVLAMGFLLLVSMTVNTLLQLLFERFEWMLPLMATGATWLVYALSFALMYHYLPDRSVGWRRALGGGLATALLFLLGRAAIGWYLGSSNPASASTYGSMGTIVLALVWIYYAALVVFIGALLTAVVDERAKASGRGRRDA
jgi:membrane protein